MRVFSGFCSTKPAGGRHQNAKVCGATGFYAGSD